MSLTKSPSPFSFSNKQEPPLHNPNLKLKVRTNHLSSEGFSNLVYDAGRAMLLDNLYMSSAVAKVT